MPVALVFATVNVTGPAPAVVWETRHSSPEEPATRSMETRATPSATGAVVEPVVLLDVNRGAGLSAGAGGEQRDDGRDEHGAAGAGTGATIT